MPINIVKFKKDRGGFTLMEILVVLSIFIILIVMGTDLMIKGLVSSAFIYEQAEAVQNGRNAADSLVKEIRKANRAETGDYLLDTVMPQQLVLYSDINSDNFTEKVNYFLDNQTLKRGVIMATGTPIQYPAVNETITSLANYINNQTEAIFTYYDKNGQPIANPAANKQNIRLINLFIKINVAPDRAPQDFILNADVQIRNLKDNL